jgi:anti-anti-sigma factor
MHEVGRDAGFVGALLLIPVARSSRMHAGRSASMAAASDRTRRDGEARVEVTEVNETGDEIVAHVVGELATVERFRDAIQPYVGRRQRLVLDLSAVTFMDTSCLKVLMQTRAELREVDGVLVLRNPSPRARRTLTAARLLELLDEVSQPDAV